MPDDTRPFDPSREERPDPDDTRQTSEFGFAEPGVFDPRPPPLPTAPSPPPRRRRRAREDRIRRGLAVVIVVLALLAGIGFERPTRRPSSSAVTTTTAPRAVSVGVGPGAGSPKSFYCPEGSTTEGAEEFLVLVNTAPSPVKAQLSFLVEEGSQPPTQVSVAAGSRLSVRVNDLVQAQGVGTLVEADTPGLAVSETLFFATDARRGALESACTSQVADTWYFAGGTTAKGYELWVLIVNPFPDDARIDVSAVADGEEVDAPEFQGVPVPARSRKSLPVHEHILRKDRVAITVTARRGRVAVAESTFLADDPQGASLTIGATAPAPAWYFGEGYSGPGVTQTVSVYNPGDAEASVAVGLLVGTGTPPPPHNVTVGAHDRSDLVVGLDLPPGTSYGMRVVANQPVVVARSQLAADPSPLRGYLFTLGTVAPQRTWIVPEAGATPPLDTFVSVANPATSDAHVTVGSLADGTLRVPANLTGVALPAGRRITFHLPEYFDGPALTLVVQADQPVVVESAIYLSDPRYGSTATPGIPVEGSVSFTAVSLPAKPPPTTTTTTTLPLTPTVAPGLTDTVTPAVPPDTAPPDTAPPDTAPPDTAPPASG